MSEPLRVPRRRGFDSLLIPRHKHDWVLVAENVVAGVKDRLEVQGHGPDELRELGYVMQGYVSYVFKCECGEVKVVRS